MHSYWRLLTTGLFDDSVTDVALTISFWCSEERPRVKPDESHVLTKNAEGKGISET